MVVRETRAREPAPFEQQQQRQQLLALADPADGDRREAKRMLGRLDAVVRSVWAELGETRGFLAVDEASMAGLAVALRRYPAAEIERCVAWSARRVADGRLSAGYFATTFRGNGFCARHSAWQADLRAVERRRAEETAIAADVAAHRAPPRQGELSGAELERRGLEVLRQLAGGAP